MIVLRRCEVETAMGPASVVVARVDAKDSFEVPASTHQRPVQALIVWLCGAPLGHGRGTLGIGVRESPRFAPGVEGRKGSLLDGLRKSGTLGVVRGRASVTCAR